MSNKSIIAKPAKMCYEHIGGKLGQLLVENFADKGWIAKNKPTDKNYYITDLGQEGFEKLGIDISQIKSEEL
ncbi:ArsR family transcriptional regulator [Flavobacterium piscisymbiosum]|uniref:ArsR family transcriptional regulator n=1 Tax=Flavobacterium piscisymbiosum TaxID=2893753 RepID=A0ABS8MKY7_9FLAO|nr:ArsR family transcriptional regulator [Flavobacterium sp. F-30]MCC9066163.1 ArsR family transcriptional regulator [Flavobacterium sp. F-30]